MGAYYPGTMNRIVSISGSERAVDEAKRMVQKKIEAQMWMSKRRKT
jgi:hypothetical protein